MASSCVTRWLGPIVLFLFATLIDVVPGTSQDHVKVQTINTDAGVVFDAQIDMFLKAEAKRSHVGETILPQFVFNDLQSFLKDLLRLGSPDGAMTGNLLVTTNTE